MAKLLAKLSSSDRSITTALCGPGGFGKTTIAARACDLLANSFPDGVMWVTIGQAPSGGDLVDKINDLALQLSGVRPTFVDPEQAGYHLGILLGDRHALLVIDDVWRAEQLAPFLSGGRNCARLVTTRIDTVLPDTAHVIRVEPMTTDESLELLTHELPHPLPDLSVLLRRTGGWPVLMHLVNSALKRRIRHGATTTVAVQWAEATMASAGVSAFDTTTGALDVTNPAARNRAVTATVEASLTLLSAPNLDRYLELAVFPDETDIPLRTLERHWLYTGGLHAHDVESLCMQLDELSLIHDLRSSAVASLRIHGVFLAYMRRRLPEGRLSQLHRALLSAHRVANAWWNMPDDEPYLWGHLVHHLQEAGKESASEQRELETLVFDLRWITAKLRLAGPASVSADLAAISGDTAKALREALDQNAHMFGPIEPRHALGSVVVSRLDRVERLQPVLDAFIRTLQKPRLVNRWPLPDVTPALRRVIEPRGGWPRGIVMSDEGVIVAMVDDGGVVLWKPLTDEVLAALKLETGRVGNVAICADISRLVCCGDDGTVRIYDISGNCRHVLRGHTGAVKTVTVSRGSRWIASSGDDRTVRIWDADTGILRSTLQSHEEALNALAFSPDGSSIATAGDLTVRIWDIGTGESRRILCDRFYGAQTILFSPNGAWLAFAGLGRGICIADSATANVHTILHGPTESFKVLAVSPDGALLAGAGFDDGTVQVFSTSNWELRSILKGHTHSLEALAFANDGRSLTSVEYDGLVRVWDPTVRWVASGTRDHTYGLEAVASSPDGTWLASAGYYATVQLWDTRTGRLLRSVDADSWGLSAVAISRDGKWLVSAGGPIEIWDSGTGERLRAIDANDNAWAVAISPDGEHVVSAGSDRAVRVWNASTGAMERAIDATSRVFVVVLSPDGRWIVTGSEDGAVRIWDVATGDLRADLRGHDRPLRALAVTHDGRYIASAGFDCTIRIWDVRRRQLSVALEGHEDTVRSLGFSQRDTLLVSTGDDHTVRVWEPASGLCQTAMRINGAGRSCAWLPDDGSLVVGGSSGLYLFTYLSDGFH